MDFNDTILVSRTPRFAGIETDDWERWISRFESLTVGLGDVERVKRLLPLLDGVALDYAHSLYQGDSSYSEIKSGLGVRFGRLIEPLQAQAELGRASQSPGESAESFADRIKRLGRAAFPHSTGPSGEGKGPEETYAERAFVMKTLTSRFICGLRDEWLQTKLCHRNPESLSAAVAVIRELHKRQEVVQAVRAANPSTHTGTEPLPLGAVASAVHAEVGGGSQQDARIAQLQQEIGQLRSSLEAFAVAKTDHLPEAVKCYGCGAPGHFRRDCPVVRRGQPRTGPRATRVKCFSCGQEGHIRSNCQSAVQAATPLQPFCLFCGEAGHWMAACHSRLQQGPPAMGGRRGLMSREALPSDKPAEN